MYFQVVLRLFLLFLTLDAVMALLLILLRTYSFYFFLLLKSITRLKSQQNAKGEVQNMTHEEVQYNTKTTATFSLQIYINRKLGNIDGNEF